MAKTPNIALEEGRVRSQAMLSAEHVDQIADYLAACLVDGNYAKVCNAIRDLRPIETVIAVTVAVSMKLDGAHRGAFASATFGRAAALGCVNPAYRDLYFLAHDRRMR